MLMESVDFGKYKLIAELGHGGMADVFLALQQGPAGSGFRKLTVIKRLRESLADEAEFITMLVDEARIAARLNHPNVVQTTEVDVVDETYFIAMEFLEGQALHLIQNRSRRVAKDGSAPLLTRDHQYLILMDVAAGLGHAHDLHDFDGTPLEIVHRDVTPQNIFVTYEGQVKVVDFGIAKAAGRASETRQGIVKGKVQYMAPEQAIGLRVTRQADIFAVGVMLWEVAVGRRMWQDREALDILQSLVAGTLPPMPREVSPDVPEEIDRICRKALAPRPEERYATAGELHADLEQYLNRDGKLVQLRRELGPIVADLFKDARAQVRALIEKQLDVESRDSVAPRESTQLMPVARPPTSAAMPVAQAPTSVSAQAVPMPGLLSSSMSMARPPVDGVDLPGSARPKWSRLAAVVLGASLALAVSGLVLGYTALSNRSKPPATKPASSDVALRITSSTPKATARIDDGGPQVLPLDTRWPRDTGPHRLVIEADGFAPYNEPVSFADDIELAVELAPLPLVATQPSASAPSPSIAPLVSAKPAPMPWRRPVVVKTETTASAKKNDPPKSSTTLDRSLPGKHN
jgi:serine/threonine-protein kinase